MVTTDRGLHNRGAFPLGVLANGVLVRQAALEAPEPIGRGRRHGCILKGVMKRLVVDHHIAGKPQMKQTAIVALETKNHVIRRDGFSPAQGVQGHVSRRPGSINEESEWGHVGVLAAQQDSTTAFAQKAVMRLTAQKAFVCMVYGRRCRAAMLRSAHHAWFIGVLALQATNGVALPV